MFRSALAAAFLVALPAHASFPFTVVDGSDVSIDSEIVHDAAIALARQLGGHDLRLMELFLPRLAPPDTLCGFAGGLHSSGKKVWRAFVYERGSQFATVLEYREPWENLNSIDWSDRRRIQDAGCGDNLRRD